MGRAKFQFDPEDSSEAFAKLVGAGLAAEWISRETDGDVIAVPIEQADEARPILGK